MKTTLIALLLLAVISTLARSELNEIETKYLKRDVEEINYGNANPFNPEHIFENSFRQRILASKDEAIQRAFILRQLPHQISSILDDLDRNQKMIGQAQYRQLTPKERLELIASFEEHMGLLASLNGGKNKFIQKDYRSRFNNIQQKYAPIPDNKKD